MIRLPADVSLKPDEYEPASVDLTSALNGLRVASKSWMLLVRRLLGAVGLVNNKAGPCLFAGMIDGKPELACCVMIYVDNLLVIGRTEPCVHKIREALAKVKTKLTGLLSDSRGDDGVITFLGRKITRHKGDNKLNVRIDPQYHNFSPHFSSDYPERRSDLSRAFRFASLDLDRRLRHHPRIQPFGNPKTVRSWGHDVTSKRGCRDICQVTS